VDAEATTVNAGAVVSVPKLKLVLAEFAPSAEAGTAAVGGVEPKLEILALPENEAAQVIAEGVGALPAAVVAQGREAASVVLGDASLAAGVEATATPTALLELLGLPITTALSIVAGINPPPNAPAGGYTSLYTVINNAISVLRAPLAALTTGQFDQVGPQTSAAWATFMTSATTGLPASVSASVTYAGEVIAAALGGGVNASAQTAAADSGVTALKAADVADEPAAASADEAPSLSALADQFSQFVPDLGAKSGLGSTAAETAQSLDTQADDTKADAPKADDTADSGDAATPDLSGDKMGEPAASDEKPSSAKYSESTKESGSADKAADKGAEKSADKGAGEDSADSAQ
jgi:hypothetical protein